MAFIIFSVEQCVGAAQTIVAPWKCTARVQSQ